MKKKFKLIAGILISGLFLFFAFGKIDFSQMVKSFAGVDYIMLIPATSIILFSIWLRSLRWQYFLKPIKKISVVRLFVATIIGNMGDTVLPAHLGQIFRANLIGNQEEISTSSILATIVIERIIDVLCLLFIMIITIFMYPFPDWVRKSGYIMFAFAIGAIFFLAFMKLFEDKTMALSMKILGIFPRKFSEIFNDILPKFINGIKGLDTKMDYVIVIVLSVIIWVCYGAVFLILFHAFNMFEIYNIAIVTSLVLIVITSISVVIPSSPGYVGTYHYMCQLTLTLFGVPAAVGLSYAFVVHAISKLPVALIGLVFAWQVGFDLLKFKRA